MGYDRELRVQGNLETLWEKLMIMLLSNGYKIRSAFPKSQIIAERGSHFLSSFFRGSTKGGHRTVTIEMYPTKQDTIIKFSAEFSKWGWGHAWRCAKEDIDEMLKNFVVRLSMDQDAHSTPFQTFNCPTCKKELSPEYSFCPYCGKALVTTCFCFNCGKQISSDFVVCPFCGIELKRAEIVRDI